MQRRARREVGLAEVLDRLPEQPKKRGRIPFTRADLDNDAELAEFDTLEAIAAGDTLITGAVFTGTLEGVAWEVQVDVLVRNPDGTYMPVMVSNHRVARPDPHKTMQGIAVTRLGLGQPLEVKATDRKSVV